MLRLLAAAAVAAWAGAAGLPAPARPAAAAAQAEHRAAVFVDTGTQVKTVCVRFAEESISGVEALARAAVDPVLRTFPGKGAAVCSLCGVGCPSDESCLTCDPDGRFWAYSRAPAGSAAFRPSPVGASSTTVRDGDVEGWRWGLGAAPPFAGVDQVCGTATAGTSTTTPPAGAAPPSTAAPPPAPTGTAAPAGRTAAAPAPARGPAAPSGPATAATTTASAPTPLSTPTSSSAAPPGAAPPATAGPAPGDGAGTALASSPRQATGQGGGSWAGLAGLGALLAVLVGWAAWARRRRRGAP